MDEGGKKWTVDSNKDGQEKEIKIHQRKQQKWTRENYKNVIKCYLNINPSKIGYRIKKI